MPLTSAEGQYSWFADSHLLTVSSCGVGKGLWSHLGRGCGLSWAGAVVSVGQGLWSQLGRGCGTKVSVSYFCLTITE